MHETNNDNLLEEIHSQMVYEFSKTLELFNLSNSDAMLFATLYLNHSPMTLDEMAKALGKSKTAMSTGIRSLLEENLVERVWKKGKRKDYYQAKENLSEKLMKSYLIKWMDSVERQKHSLKELEGDLQSKVELHKNEQIQFLHKRIHDILEFHIYIEEIFEQKQ